MNRSIALLTALFSLGCSFSFDRGEGLEPGDVEGFALQANGEAAGFARVSVDGTGRVLRADREGRFLVRGLPLGTWALRLDYDRDGDGWPEELASRAIQIRAGSNGVASFVVLGPVQLEGPASLRGTVQAPEGVAVAGARVAITRTIPLSTGQVEFDADQAAEAQVGAGVSGGFLFASLEQGAAHVRVLLETGGVLYASDDLEVDLGPGDNTLPSPIVVSLRSTELAGPDDPLPEGTPISVGRRLASLFVAPDLAGDERATVDFVRTGLAPAAVRFNGPRTFGAQDSFTLDDVPVGLLDVYVRTDQGREGVLHQRMIPPAEGTDVIEWGLIQLRNADDGCVLGEDCDLDNVLGLPPRNGADDPLWSDCATQCDPGAAFDIATVAEARCVVDGDAYDCDDDGDGQPDVFEPGCYGAGLGRDSDGDATCDPVDPFPFCAANDDTCDPDEVTGLYGRGDAPPPPPPLDAGPTPDAGLDGGADAGVTPPPPFPPFASVASVGSVGRSVVVHESGATAVLLDTSGTGTFGDCFFDAAGQTTSMIFVFESDGACRYVISLTPPTVTVFALQLALRGDELIAVGRIGGTASFGNDPGGTPQILIPVGARAFFLARWQLADGQILSAIQSTGPGIFDPVGIELLPDDGFAIAGRIESGDVTLGENTGSPVVLPFNTSATDPAFVVLNPDLTPRAGVVLDSSSGGDMYHLGVVDEGDPANPTFFVTGEFTGDLLAGETGALLGGDRTGYVARLAADLSVQWTARMNGPFSEGAAISADNTRAFMFGAYFGDSSILSADGQTFASYSDPDFLGNGLFVSYSLASGQILDAAELLGPSGAYIDGRFHADGTVSLMGYADGDVTLPGSNTVLTGPLLFTGRFDLDDAQRPTLWIRTAQGASGFNPSAVAFGPNGSITTLAGQFGTTTYEGVPGDFPSGFQHAGVWRSNELVP